MKIETQTYHVTSVESLGDEVRRLMGLGEVKGKRGDHLHVVRVGEWEDEIECNHWYNGSEHYIQVEKVVMYEYEELDLSDIVKFDQELGGINYYKAEVYEVLAYLVHRDMIPEGNYLVSCSW